MSHQSLLAGTTSRSYSRLLSRLRSGHRGENVDDFDSDNNIKDASRVSKIDMAHDRKSLGSGMSRLQLLAAASSNLYSGVDMMGTPSTRFDVIVDGVPTAADQIRQGIEKSRSYASLKNKMAQESRENENSGNDLSGTCRSWFDENGEP